MKPAMIRSSVVLPHPLGPSSATSSPGAMSSDTRSTAVEPAYRWSTSSRVRR